MKDVLCRVVPLALLALVVPACGDGGGGGGGGGGGAGAAPPPPGANQPPGIVLIQPASGATFAAGDSVVVEADITDGDGFVTQVAFFQGSTLLATVGGFPFRFTWTPAAGSYSLTATATDNGGAQTASLPVAVTVGSPVNRPPTVSLTSPPDGTTVPDGYPAAIEADASDPDGALAGVEFFDGTTSLGTVTTAPYRIPWTATPPGSHSLRAVATDDSGASTSSASATVTVTAVGGPPPPPPTVRPEGLLQGVFFADASTGWIVGEAGRIYKTADGGVTWIAQAGGTTQPLARVQFVSSTVGWAVGGGGTILKTVDGGATWTSPSSGTTASLTGLSFVGAATGWVVGEAGVILKTTDGGTSWTPLDGGTSDNLGCVSFVSTTHGFIGGFSEILSTADGGATWNRQSSDFTSPSALPSTAHFLDARFMSPLRGTMVGNSRTGDVLWTTTDGGATWTRHNTDAPPYTMCGVAFGDAQSVVAVGTWGNVAYSSDGGLTWTRTTAPTLEILRGVWMVSATTGWAVGPNGTVLRTTDGGATWLVLAGPT